MYLCAVQVHYTTLPSRSRWRSLSENAHGGVGSPGAERLKLYYSPYMDSLDIISSKTAKAT